jgi:glutathione S-transferase
MEAPFRFVDVATARAARGLRLAVSGVLPSPWSEAAKGIIHVKQIEALIVRFRRGDAELAGWTGATNVPVALFDDEPPRTGWAEILALAERIGGRTPLVPDAPELRLRLHGLAHELAGEGGLGWCARLIMIDGGLASGGARGFPLPVAQYLAPKYGYAPERVAPARARIAAILSLFDATLAHARAAGGTYLLGEQLTAIDIYLATFLNPLLGDAEIACPAMVPAVRPAWAYLHEQVGDVVPAALAAHRARMYERHLPWPIPI